MLWVLRGGCATLLLSLLSACYIKHNYCVYAYLDLFLHFYPKSSSPSNLFPKKNSETRSRCLVGDSIIYSNNKLSKILIKDSTFTSILFYLDRDVVKVGYQFLAYKIKLFWKRKQLDLIWRIETRGYGS